LNVNNLCDSSRAKVAVTACGDYEAINVERAVERQFTLLGESINISRGDVVLLKPNLIIPRPAECPAQTHPAVILAAVKAVIELGGKPVVSDSPAWGDVTACIEALELKEPLEKLGAKVVQMNRPVNQKIAGARVGISRTALEADKIINLPKFKAHQQLGATFAIKNMFGCVAGKEKVYWHFAKGADYHDFCSMLIGIYELLGPMVTILDGIIAMEGQGPVSGEGRNLGVMVGSADPVACEMVCCEIVKFKPQELPLICSARKLGFGCWDMDKIEVVGDDYKPLICDDFKASELTPLSFTFFRICKSIGKQIIIMTKYFIDRIKCER
jgi:uncharacterized protein (DUF362 family)